MWPASDQLIDTLTSAARGRFHELRRKFAADFDAARIQATSVLNGAFADMLTGTAPMMPFGRRQVIFKVAFCRLGALVRQTLELLTVHLDGHGHTHRREFVSQHAVLVGEGLDRVPRGQKPLSISATSPCESHEYDSVSSVGATYEPIQ
jgi:hypothetical protein